MRPDESRSRTRSRRSATLEEGGRVLRVSVRADRSPRSSTRARPPGSIRSRTCCRAPTVNGSPRKAASGRKGPTPASRGRRRTRRSSRSATSTAGRGLRRSTLRDGTLFSYVMNNYWYTDTPARQGGRFTFRYALASGRDSRLTDAIALSADQRSPLVAIRRYSMGWEPRLDAGGDRLRGGVASGRPRADGAAAATCRQLPAARPERHTRR